MYVSFEHLSPTSRVWIYQADRNLLPEEERTIADALVNFCGQWAAHGNPLQTSFKIEYHRFVILAVDESAAGASGCSIDGSVKVLKELGNQLGVDFFDRAQVAFLIDGQIKTYKTIQLGSLFESASLNPSVLTFNNFVAEKSALDSAWKTTAEKSWLLKYLPKNTLSA